MRKARFALILGVLVGLLMLPMAAMADSITPSSVSATLAVGGSVTVDKTVTVSAGTPTTSKVDVFFLADTTGSMGGVINSVKASAGSILSSTAGLGDVAFGVGEYKDNGDAYVYRRNTDLTTVQANAQAGINLWAASGGGDYQEANLYALQQVSTTTSWRAGSSRILVWFGDASGHDPSGPTGVTEAQATAALTGQSIEVEAIDVGSMNDTGQAGRIAAATGGVYYAGIDSSSIVDTITDAITTAFATYSTVSLDTSEVPLGVSVGFTPLSYVGSFDRSVERTFDFSVTFTGVAPGDYAFNIYGTVDGGRVAVEADRIKVGVPEPASMLLLSIGLSALGLFRLRRRES